MTSIHRLSLSVLLFLVVVAGCSQSRRNTTVSGKVTYKGQSVPSGTVTFHRTGGEEQSGSFAYPLKADGTYEAAGLVPEEMVVTIETESANPKRPTPTYQSRGGGKNQDPMGDYDKMMKEKGYKTATPTDPSLYVAIPKKYADKKTTPLKVTITTGKNVFNFDLQD